MPHRTGLLARAMLAAFAILVLVVPIAAASPARPVASAGARALLSVGSNSCVGTNACDGATGNIGDNSCNASFACRNQSGNIGNGSCNVQSACDTETGRGAFDVGDNSCNGNDACYEDAGTVGKGSCNGAGACYFNGLTTAVGNYSCNGDSSCSSPTVGDCQNNTVTPDPCKAKPDTIIRLSGYSRVGDDVYDGTGAGEVLDQKPRHFRDGAVRTFYVYFQNDGTIADSFTISAIGTATTRYGLEFQRPGGADISADVLGGTFVTPMLDPGDSYAIRVKVTVKASAPKPSTFAFLLFQTSNLNDGLVDAAGFSLKRK